jgi:hypothetical protein
MTKRDKRHEEHFMAPLPRHEIFWPGRKQFFDKTCQML